MRHDDGTEGSEHEGDVGASRGQGESGDKKAPNESSAIDPGGEGCDGNKDDAKPAHKAENRCANGGLGRSISLDLACGNVRFCRGQQGLVQGGLLRRRRRPSPRPRLRPVGKARKVRKAYRAHHETRERHSPPQQDCRIRREARRTEAARHVFRSPAVAKSGAREKSEGQSRPKHRLYVGADDGNLESCPQRRHAPSAQPVAQERRQAPTSRYSDAGRLELHQHAHKGDEGHGPQQTVPAQSARLQIACGGGGRGWGGAA